MSMQNLTLSEFSEVLSKSDPVPGGGGAAALCGALAAALGSMVGALTVGKKKYAAYEESLRELIRRADEARLELLALIDGDAEAFAPLAAAYAIPKDAPVRDEKMEECLRAAASTPMRMVELCCTVIELQEGFFTMGSRLAVSDAGCGAALALGAMHAASYNVLINTRLMKDRAYADALNSRVNALTEEYAVRAGKVCQGTRDLLV